MAYFYNRLFQKAKLPVSLNSDPTVPTVKNNGLRMLVDLKALEHNVHIIRQLAHPAELSCIVKANAYGIGYEGVSEKLYELGVQKFFVANTWEGICLRNLLPYAERIYVLNGIIPQDMEDYHAYKLTPVLNTIQQLKNWVEESQKYQKKLSAILHFDTGMNRLGFDPEEIPEIKKLITALEIECIISHLAQADTSHHPYNQKQQQKFKDIIEKFPGHKYSLAATEALQINAEYYYDMVRIGMGLYGALPPKAPGPLAEDLRFAFKTQARILQIRTIKPGETAGYGQTFKAIKPTRLAVLPLGFVDGIPRAASNSGHVYVQHHSLPIVGRVSMDLTIVDVTDAPEELTSEGSWVDLIRDSVSLYTLAQEWNTGVYEIITRISERFERIYIQ
jgi:alanine racemase